MSRTLHLGHVRLELLGMRDPSARVDAPRIPTDEETAERAIAATRHMTPDERWELLRWLLDGMDALLEGRKPFRPEEDPPFWMRWKDPTLGRPA